MDPELIVIVDSFGLSQFIQSKSIVVSIPNFVAVLRRSSADVLGPKLRLYGKRYMIYLYKSINYL